MHVRTKRPFVDCNMDTFRGHLWAGYGYSTIGVGWDMDPIPFAAICGLRMDFLLVVIYDWSMDAAFTCEKEDSEGSRVSGQKFVHCPARPCMQNTPGGTENWRQETSRA